MSTATTHRLEPNPLVLEAQARVCTGPHQTRPLGRKSGDPDPAEILRIIIGSARGEEIETGPASRAQMGAFFAGMTIRKAFGKKTSWSDAETGAFRRFRSDLKSLPEEVGFLIRPAGGLSPADPDEAPVIAALTHILAGKHLGYDDTRDAITAILDGSVRETLAAAVLIGQRMNLENGDELRAYLDSALDPGRVVPVEVESIAHLGEPYDGSARYFRPTLFVAAVLAATGHPTLLHGTERMPPKFGVTDEQILSALGGRADLSLESAADLVSDPAVGFAYVSQSVFAPSLHNLADLRLHIKKRPAFSTTEKCQQIFRSSGGAAGNRMVVGYNHSGYEQRLLRLMESRDLGLCAAMKGEEGTSHLSLRLGKPSSPERRAINYAEGFSRRGDSVERFSMDIDPVPMGFSYADSPRMDAMAPESMAAAGRAALAGEPGPDMDRILLNAAAKAYILGFSSDLDASLRNARDALLSGRALAHLDSLIARSQA